MEEEKEEKEEEEEEEEEEVEDKDGWLLVTPTTLLPRLRFADCCALDDPGRACFGEKAKKPCI